MNATFTIDKETGYIYDHIHLASTQQGSTFHTMKLELKVVAEAGFIMRDNHIQYPTLPEIGDDWTDEEEQKWDSLFAQPHVQAGLNRLAKEAEQQFAQGEFEEGGFAVE